MSIPESIGPFRVLGKLGEGGMGVVFRVQDPAAPRELALKLILESRVEATALERFRREAEVLGRVNHRNVVRVHQFGQAHEGTYLAMELIDGECLRDLCGEPMDFERAARVVRDMADACAALHAEGVLHRDIKPDNVMLRRDGIPVLLDFGLVQDKGASRLTKTGASLGTLAYMSPEQIGGESTAHLDARTDVYSLGVVLYELITGMRPFEGPPAVVVGQVLHTPPPRPSTEAGRVPAGLEAACLVCLAKAPDARYPTAAALRDDLDRFLRGEALVAQRMRAGRRGLPPLLSALLVVAALVLGTLGYLVATRAESTLTAEEARTQIKALSNDALELLKAPGPFAVDAERIAALRASADRLSASSPDGLPRAVERVTALEGLLALASGERRAARSLASTLEADARSPAACALRGAVAALDPRADAAAAARDLSRAIKRGFARHELRLWRVRAYVREGLSDAQVASEALADLDALAALRAPTQTEQEVRVRVLVALGGRLDEAQKLLESLDPSPVDLRWTVALARVRVALANEPSGALAPLEGLPEQERPDPVRRDLAADALLQGRLLASHLDDDVERESARRLSSLLAVARRLVPTEPPPADMIEGLMQAVFQDVSQDATGRRAGELALEVAALAPDDFEVQSSLGKLAHRLKVPAPLRRRLLPILERAAALAPSPRERVELEFVLCTAYPLLNDLHEECVAVAGRVLPRLEDDLQTARVLDARGRALRGLGRSEDALVDFERVIELDVDDVIWTARFFRGRILEGSSRVDEALGAYMQILGHGEFHLKANSIQFQAILRVWELTWDTPANRPQARRAVERFLVRREGVHPGWWLRGGLLQLEDGDAAHARETIEACLPWLRESATAKDLAGRVERVLELLPDEAAQALALMRELVTELEKRRAGGSAP